MESMKEELLGELVREEARLAELDRQRKATCSRMESLRARLAVLPIVTNTEGPATPGEKVRLFRALFRGRDDIFPTRFVSKRTGKSGYAPACTNKFVRGVCELPKVKCSECLNQAFTPIDDQMVLGHLRGQHVMGIYPLLEDETCWLLAVDFDKASWQDDVGAFIDTSRAMGVPVAVERSRSGNGAHVWCFFATPVAASLARQMGCYLLTETMARRHQLSMGSYDRFFPNQDTMPRGGFGNLIALPLQHEPRQQGNSIFVDQQFQAYANQWAFLASVPRMVPSTVEALAKEATRRGLVVGLRFAAPADGEESTPWLCRPSGRPRQVPISGPLPRQVRAVLGQRLFVEKTELPSPLLNQIKRLAAFQNPDFYKKQSMRLSTAITPRARYILGLTATPHRRDGHHPILEMQLGPVRFAVDPKSQAARRGIASAFRVAM